jgi:hypothetical protein
MINTIEILSQFICTSTGIGIASLGLAASGNAGIIEESTLLPLSLFLGGIVVTTALTWRAASLKNELTRKLDNIEHRIVALEKKKCTCNKGKR